MHSTPIRLIDLHQDLAFSSQKSDVRDEPGQSSLKELKELGDSIVFSVIFPHISTWNERSEELSIKYGFKQPATSPQLSILLEQFKLYHFYERTGLVKIVKMAEDLDNSGLNFLISLEGADVLTDPYDIYLLRDIGLRCLGLTWNYDNKFAATAMSKKDYGLTGYGEEIVKLCNINGITIDGAHASKKTIIEAAEISSKPIIVSHANARKIHDHVRNLDDETIEAVVSRGGIIGVTAITTTLSGNPGIDDIVTHATYIGENFGWKHVALGTDFMGIPSVPSRFENISKIRDLEKLLGEHSDEVLWKNAYRILKQNLQKSAYYRI